MDKIELVQGMSTEVVVRPQTKKRKLNENNQPPEPVIPFSFRSLDLTPLIPPGPSQSYHLPRFF